MLIHTYDYRRKIGDISPNVYRRLVRNKILRKGVTCAPNATHDVRQPGNASNARKLYICKCVSRSITRLKTIERVTILCNVTTIFSTINLPFSFRLFSLVSNYSSPSDYIGTSCISLNYKNSPYEE